MTGRIHPGETAMAQSAAPSNRGYVQVRPARFKHRVVSPSTPRSRTELDLARLESARGAGNVRRSTLARGPLWESSWRLRAQEHIGHTHFDPEGQDAPRTRVWETPRLQTGRPTQTRTCVSPVFAVFPRPLINSLGTCTTWIVGRRHVCHGVSLKVDSRDYALHTWKNSLEQRKVHVAPRCFARASSGWRLLRSCRLR